MLVPKNFTPHLIGNPAGLPEPGEQGTVHGGGIVADSVLAAKENPRRILEHVIALARIPGNDRRGQVVVVVARCACGVELKLV